jgi:hypothetical protein
MLRPRVNRTPSRRNRFLCSAANCRLAIVPSLRTTRHHGAASPSGSDASAQPTMRAPLRSPTCRAISP